MCFCNLNLFAVINRFLKKKIFYVILFIYFFIPFQDRSHLNPLQTLTEEEDAVLRIDEWTTPAD